MQKMEKSLANNATVEVQTDLERQRLDDLAKVRGVIDAGTSSTGRELLPLLPIPGTIDAGTARRIVDI